MSRSDIARLREQIDLEIAAMRRVRYGFAVVSRHEIITHHLENVSVHFEALSIQIGEEAALQAVMDALDNLL